MTGDPRRKQSHIAADGSHSPSSPLDVRETLIEPTVEALLLDLQEFPDVTVNSPWGTDHEPDKREVAWMRALKATKGVIPRGFRDHRRKEVGLYLDYSPPGSSTWDVATDRVHYVPTRRVAH